MSDFRRCCLSSVAITPQLRQEDADTRRRSLSLTEMAEVPDGWGRGPLSGLWPGFPRRSSRRSPFSRFLACSSIPWHPTSTCSVSRFPSNLPQPCLSPLSLPASPDPSFVLAVPSCLLVHLFPSSHCLSPSSPPQNVHAWITVCLYLSYPSMKALALILAPPVQARHGRQVRPGCQAHPGIVSQGGGRPRVLV